MEFIATNGQIIALLVVILLFLIYELFVKNYERQEDEIISFLAEEEQERDAQADDKSLDKEVLEAVKIAVKIHREKSNE